MNHCIAKIVEIIDRGSDDRRSILQLGYNLGRLSEVTGLGREPFWDRWKDPVDAWDLPQLRLLARELLQYLDHTSSRSDLKEPRFTEPQGELSSNDFTV
jgi:hypothetical protein